MLSVNEQHALDLIPHIKELLTSGEIAPAVSIIESAPDLKFLLIDVMRKLNLLDGDVVAQTLRSGTASTLGAIAPPVPAPATASSGLAPATNGAPYGAVAYTQPPLGAAPAPMVAGGGFPSLCPPQATAVPPPQAAAAAPPPNAAAMLAAMSPDQQTAVINFLAMTPEQISLLPASQQNDVLSLRRAFGL